MTTQGNAGGSWQSLGGRLEDDQEEEWANRTQRRREEAQAKEARNTAARTWDEIRGGLGDEWAKIDDVTRRDVVAHLVEGGFPVHHPLGPNKEWELELFLRRQGERLVCTSLSLRPKQGPRSPGPVDGISPNLLKRIPLRRLIDEMTSHLWESKDLGQGSNAGPPPAKVRGRPGYSDDHYRWIAGLYVQGYKETPRSPIKWLVNQCDLGYSRATISNWVDEARRRGFLPRPGQGRAGLGIPDPEHWVVKSAPPTTEGLIDFAIRQGMDDQQFLDLIKDPQQFPSLTADAQRSLDRIKTKLEAPTEKEKTDG